MKKIVAICLISLLTMLSFTGCFFNKSETEFEETLNTQLDIIYQDLLKNLPNTADLEACQEYLIDWAGARNIPVSYDKQNNVIMSKKATAGYEEAQTTTFQCSIGIGDPAQQYQAMATALYLIDQVENHGFVRVLFTAATDTEFPGAQYISANYLRGDNLINLTWAEKTSFTVGSAGTAEYDFSKQLQWIEPTYPNAYELSIKGLNGGSSGITSGSHPNPIKLIGDFLASAKSKGVLIELASFNGGEDTAQYPTGATAVVLINDNDVNRFQKWFDNDASKFKDNYGDIEENYTYTLTPVAPPAYVISKDDSTNVFSLLYTMINGIYQKSDEGNIVATSNIGTIRTDTGNLDVTICARSQTEEALAEISSTFEIICGLNDESYKITDQFPIWTAQEDSPLQLHLTELFQTEFNKEIKHKSIMQNTECAIFKSRVPYLDVLSMSVNFENGIQEIGVLQRFLESSNTPWTPAAEEKNS
ncbi:aminoacyl-histidine dipeptidase [Aminipila butyrica]|uniref:Aminoacyl-histidine dipeptidase n=1 Tax=Aminipila butyrica TaxID=433296 RepID=A0A858BWT0_9FIRM|nr:aminoacyl-histidine dipeptidase [Aminipila butyrica]QIB69360.1 aminoacyl-histidine dipeptidase [Aminipila butyrica]